MKSAKASIAQQILSAVGSGNLPTALFTADARWWWNGGLDLSLADFNALLGQLHTQTENGVNVTPGLALEQGDAVVIEATFEALLKNGKQCANRYLFLFPFDGDAVRQVKEYSDTAHVAAVFGLGE